tara:strand:+ start:9334 stop:9660 length:327 start_codon:yes stop_codon:yes gene_type:complete
MNPSIFAADSSRRVSDEELKRKAAKSREGVSVPGMAIGGAKGAITGYKLGGAPGAVIGGVLGAWEGSERKGTPNVPAEALALKEGWESASETRKRLAKEALKKAATSG